MKIVAAIITLLLIAVAAVFAMRPRTSYLKTLPSLKEEDIDIGTVALTLSKEMVPEIGDVEAYSLMLDMLASRVEALIGGATDPDIRIRGINTVLFQREGITYNNNKTDNKDSYTIYHALVSKRGNCMALATLYLAVAQRLGYPIYPVMTPDHVFLRYICPDMSTINIEATSGGGENSDEGYIRICNIDREAVASGVYMHIVGRKEFVSNLLIVNAAIAWKRGQRLRAVDILETARVMNPTNTEVLAKLAAIYQCLSERGGIEDGLVLRRRAIELLSTIDTLRDKEAKKWAGQRVL